MGVKAVGYSVIDYLNNLNGPKQVESYMSKSKFHRYAEHVHAFIDSLCAESDGEVELESGLLRGPGSSGGSLK